MGRKWMKRSWVCEVREEQWRKAKQEEIRGGKTRGDEVG